MVQKSILVSISFLLLTSCSFRLEPNQDSAEAGSPTGKPNNESEITAQNIISPELKTSFLELSNPGFYNLQIVAPENIAELKILKQGDVKELTVQGHIADLRVEHSENFFLGVKTYDSQGSLVREHVLELTAPKDLFIERPLSLAKDEVLEAQRIYISPAGLIQTNGRKLVLKARYLEIFQRPNQVGYPTAFAQIFTTKPGHFYEDEQQKAGSKILLDVEEAHGSLKVAMIGFDGHSGRSGNELDKILSIARDLDPKTNGTMGSAGQSKEIRCSGTTVDGDCSRLFCTDDPTNGTNGTMGAPGTNGEDAQPGGNAGHLEIKISNADNFLIELYSQKGRPGQPGKGGDGSPGGRPGLAHPNPAPGCAKARDGQPGPKGLQGAEGARAKAGGDAIYVIPDKVRIHAKLVE
jgi:hypothetical protein